MAQDEPVPERRRFAALSQAIGTIAPLGVSGIDELLERAEKIEAWLAKAGEPVETKPVPAVPVEQSVTSDHVICLICGAKHQMLKRHLKAVHKLTPDEYREIHGLPGTYPMVAPEYSKRRTQLARDSGLGTRPRSTLPDEAA